METRIQLKEIMSLLDENPEARAEFENIIDDYYTKWKDSIMELKEAGIVESIPAFIFVYGTHGDGYLSYACASEIGYDEANRLWFLHDNHHPINRVTIKENGDCYICITTEQLKEFAQTMAKKYFIQMRGAEKYPYIVLKLTNNQLMRLNCENIDMNVSFSTEDGENITSALERTMTKMSGAGYQQFPKIRLSLRKDSIKLNYKDSLTIEAILKLFEQKGILDTYLYRQKTYVRITNGTSALSISEMILLAQHISYLMCEGKINKRDYTLETELPNKTFFENSCQYRGWIDCTARDSKEHSIEDKLQIDIKDGIYTTENIRKIYRYLDKQCRDFLNVIPIFNELAVKAEQQTFDKEDYNTYSKSFFDKIGSKNAELINAINHRKSLYFIIKLLVGLQDPDEPIVPQNVIDAVNTADNKDPIELVRPHLEEFRSSRTQ